MKLMILDGNSIINRAFYGVRLLSTREGVFTNAVFGFLNILEKLEKEENPDAVCVAFDLKGPTFRHLQYDGYKATRHGMPEELCQQMPIMKDVLRAMNIPIYECQGWEADDILGTVGVKCQAAGWDCVIVTGDRDSLQLIDEHVFVKLVCTKGGQTQTTLYDRALFREEYGLEPKGMIDLKSLMGDSSDNIPGVAGVGPKTASQLLMQYGTLDGVYENLDAIKESVRKKLEAGRDSAYLSYDLATIRCEAPIEFDPEENRVKPYDNDALYELFQKLEFSRLIQRYGLHAPKPAEPDGVEGTCQSELVSDLARAKTLLEQFRDEPNVTVLAYDGLDEVYVETPQQMCVFSRTALGADHMAVLKALFAADIRKVSHDCKPLMRTLLEQDLPIDGIIFDTALAAYLMDATKGSYPVGALCQQYCNFTLAAAEAKEVGEAAAKLASRMSETSGVTALYAPLSNLLFQQELGKLYYDLELPLCATLARMEVEGVLVDQMALISFGSMLQSRIDKAQSDIFRYAEEEFNINSTKKLGEILFEKLQLPTVKKTKTGYSTNAEVLEKLRPKHPIIDCILDYRMLTKLKSTYADGLVKEIGEDGRIHTTFQNLVTATGRLSSTEPNLQNIPVRTELGSEIRKMFVPKDGCVFVDADYSQIELRVLAHIAGDSRMQEAFTSGMDVHTATAAQVFGVAPGDVTPLMRRNAKAVNFGIVYGISAFSLSEDIGVSVGEAKAYIENYLNNYQGVRTYMQDIVAQAKQDGYVQTLLGRRRALPELKSSNFNLRSFGERVALNSPIQGTAADIMKLAMLRVEEALRRKKLQARLLLQVHDEIIVECPMKETETVKQIVTQEMQNVMQLSVPLLVEAKSGVSWYEAK